MGNDQAAQQPRVCLLIQSSAIREHRRQLRQLLPEALHVEVEVDVDTQEQYRRDNVEANDGNHRPDDRQR